MDTQALKQRAIRAANRASGNGVIALPAGDVLRFLLVVDAAMRALSIDDDAEEPAMSELKTALWRLDPNLF
ncbi:MAG: hypothetical protein JW892_17535 [Anaerolineae bacterium]|nr:hypothetical protein [Anaerolineae bacterium]